MGNVIATPDNTIGVLYDTALISSALYGAGCLQAWFYFRKYSKRDPLLLRALMGLILLCDTVQMILLSEAVYRYTVTYHGDDAMLNHVEKTLLIELFFSGGIAITTQMFYVWRIFVLSKSWILALGVAALAWTAFLVLFVYTALILKYELLTELLGQIHFSTVTNAFGAACDVAITLIMVMYLERSKTGFKKSTDMINRLIIFTFKTPVFRRRFARLGVSFVALQLLKQLSQENAFPNTFLYIFFYLLMGRFYTNSILVTLNSRDYIRDGARSGESQSVNEISLSGMGNTANRGNQSTRLNLQEISIRINTNRTHDALELDSKDYTEDNKASSRGIGSAV